MLLRCRGRVSAFAAQLHIVLSLVSVLSLGVGDSYLYGFLKRTAAWGFVDKNS